MPKIKQIEKKDNFSLFIVTDNRSSLKTSAIPIPATAEGTIRIEGDLTSSSVSFNMTLTIKDVKELTILLEELNKYL